MVTIYIIVFMSSQIIPLYLVVFSSWHSVDNKGSPAVTIVILFVSVDERFSVCLSGMEDLLLRINPCLSLHLAISRAG